jgi:hypothetical protein
MTGGGATRRPKAPPKHPGRQSEHHDQRRPDDERAAGGTGPQGARIGSQTGVATNLTLNVNGGSLTMNGGPHRIPDPISLNNNNGGGGKERDRIRNSMAAPPFIVSEPPFTLRVRL